MSGQKFRKSRTRQVQYRKFQLHLSQIFSFPRSRKKGLLDWADMKKSECTDFVKLLNVSIDNLSMQDLLESLEQGVVFTPNVDHVMKLQRDPEFYAAYQQADYRVCDSQVLLYAAQFLGSPIKERISGSDLFPAFCHYHQNNSNTRIFLLGSAPGVAEKARKQINQRVGREIIIAAHSPSFGFEKNPQECQEIINLINQSRATVLAIGVGCPKQEKWILKYKDQLPYVKIFLAIGATIDFEAGILKRAPQWMSSLGLEWIFRISQQPKRLWKRYLIEDLPFLRLAIQQKLGLYQPPAFDASSKSYISGTLSHSSFSSREL